MLLKSVAVHRTQLRRKKWDSVYPVVSHNLSLLLPTQSMNAHYACSSEKKFTLADNNL